MPKFNLKVEELKDQLKNASVKSAKWPSWLISSGFRFEGLRESEWAENMMRGCGSIVVGRRREVDTRFVEVADRTLWPCNYVHLRIAHLRNESRRASSHSSHWEIEKMIMHYWADCGTIKPAVSHAFAKNGIIGSRLRKRTRVITRVRSASFLPLRTIISIDS